MSSKSAGEFEKFFNGHPRTSRFLRKRTGSTPTCGNATLGPQISTGTSGQSGMLAAVSQSKVPTYIMATEIKYEVSRHHPEPGTCKNQGKNCIVLSIHIIKNCSALLPYKILVDINMVEKIILIIR